MLRTYKVKHCANKTKIDKVVDTLKEYRTAAEKIAGRQWYLFFAEGDFNKNAGIKSVNTALSERYKQTCQYQVVGALKSFISNRKNDFVEIVCSSALSEQTKIELLYINKYGKWFNDTVQKPKYNDKNKRVKGEYVDISIDVIKLARKIFKHVLSNHRKPSMKRINMALDQKVAVITKKDENKAKKFDYWIRFSTLESKKPVYLPIESNDYFESVPGEHKKFCQVNYTESGELTVSFVKDKPKAEYKPETPKIALDLGLKNLFTTDKGDIFGKKFFATLLKYDTIITNLAARRQKQGLRIKSPRYTKLINKLRAYLKNEINRIINRIIELYSPREIAVEKLDFRNSKLSKRLNRLISRFGKRIIAEKLESVKEELGIKITYVNPAYTSQTCFKCGYVDKNNRTTQATFWCKHCGNKLHADVNASRNILVRSSDRMGSIYVSKKLVLQLLVERFTGKLERRSRRNSTAKDLLLSNPYFKDYRERFKGVLPA